MSDNIWQRFKLLLTRELNNAHEDATEAALRCVIRAAEDAEREGREARIYPCAAEGCDVLRNVAEGGTTFTVCDKHWPIAQPTPPAPSLPPLDPALVEECARELWPNEWEHMVEGSRHGWRSKVRAALTHYRERVEGPLREELAGWMQHVHNAFDEEVKACAEADRLRGELNQYDERGHEAQLEIDRLRGELASEKVASRRYADSTDTAIACGSHDDPTAGNCGECRACVVAERDRLRRELAQAGGRAAGPVGPSTGPGSPGDDS